MVRERLRHGLPGIPILVVAFLVLAGVVWVFASGVAREDPSPLRILTAVGLFIAWIFLMGGFFMVAPNEANVLQLFGDYVGTAKVRSALREPFLQEAQAVAARQELREQSAQGQR